MSCVICKFDGTIAKGRRFDDRYGYPKEYSLIVCAQCGHQSLRANFSPAELTELYSNYYPRGNLDIESYQPYSETAGLRAWLRGDKSSPFRWVPRNVKVLDIGCGFGESLGYHRNRGCEIYGVEADSNIRRVVEKYGYQVHVGLFDATIYEEQTFDFVTMSQVIEHVVDPVEVLSGIQKILKPKGELILSTPNANGWGAWLFGSKWINWHAPYHLHFFSDESLKKAAEIAGLIVEKKTTITPSAWLHYQWIHLLTYPVLGQPSVFWNSENSWTIRQITALKLLNLLDKVGVNYLITRLFDSIGWGDNNLYFLRKP